jgi:hypothetical protein
MKKNLDIGIARIAMQRHLAISHHYQNGSQGAAFGCWDGCFAPHLLRGAGAVALFASKLRQAGRFQHRAANPSLQRIAFGNRLISTLKLQIR